MSIYPEGSVEFEEEEVFKRIYSDIKDHLNYITLKYNVAMLCSSLVDDKKQNDISRSCMLSLAILSRITNYLRSVAILCSKGYPEQSAALASSVFELAHTLCYIGNNDEFAKRFIDMDIKKYFPHAISSIDPARKVRLRWKSVVEENCKNIVNDSSVSDIEYMVYKQLCWFKHSHHKLYKLLLDMKSGTLSFKYGPYDDDFSIMVAWFAMQHAGRLTGLAISSLIKNHKTYLSDTHDIISKLKECCEIRTKLKQCAINRFGKNSPFE